VNDNLTLDGSYARRINRPRIWDVNPYRWYTGIYSYNMGNPELIPSLQDNIEFNIGIKNKFFINFYYNIKYNPIISLPYSIGNFIENLKTNNGKIENYGTNLNANVSFINHMENSFSLNIGGYNFITNYLYTQQNKPIVITFSGNETYEFTNSFDAELDFSSTLPGGWYGITTQTGSYKIDLSAKKTLYGGKLVVSISAEDIFRSSSPIYKTETPQFHSSAYNYYDFQLVGINIKYKFGKELKSSVRKKSGLSTSEKMRL
jgi:hypothetical protein